MGTWRCTNVLFGYITPRGQNGQENQFGHEFGITLTLNYQPVRIGMFTKPNLEWNEQIITVTKPAGAWQQTNIQHNNMYALNQWSNTFQGWNLSVQNLDAKKVERINNQIQVPMADTPKLGMGANGKTERRIIYFDLGIREGGYRATAVQILEIDNGYVTIMKFLTPGLLPGSIAINDPRLQNWRTDYQNQIYR
jgi:hypothetical protein